MTKIKADKIKVTNRIRKEYGNLQSLADDILENGLINPPVIAEGTNELIAGERRLKAMRDILGWAEIPVRYVNVRDEEHRLKMEISENEERKDFSKAERIDWARRLERIESIKAKERQATSTGGSNPQLTQNFAEAGQAGETAQIVAEKAGIGSKENYRKEKYIVDHQDTLTPKDFADWDEGRLSTNKVFNKIKEALTQANSKNKSLKSELSALKSQPTNTNDEIINQLKQQLAETQAKLEDTTNRLDEAETTIQDYTFGQNSEEQDPILTMQIQTAAAFDTRVHHFIEDLGSARYARFMSVIDTEPTVKDSITHAIQSVENWLKDIKPLVMQNFVDSSAVEVVEPLTVDERFNQFAEELMRRDLYYHEKPPKEVSVGLIGEWNDKHPREQLDWDYLTQERVQELLAIPPRNGFEEYEAYLKKAM